MSCGIGCLCYNAGPMDLTALTFVVRFVAAAMALLIIGRLTFTITSRAYLSWRAYAFYVGTWGLLVALGVYRLIFGPQIENRSLIHLFTTSVIQALLLLALLACLWELVVADRRRHQDSHKLMDQWRMASNLAQKRARELETLMEITRELASSLELRGVLQAVVDRARTLSDADAVTVFVYNLETRELTNSFTSASTEQLRSPLPPSPNGLTAAVARSGQDAFVSDMQRQSLYADDSGHNLRALASLPMLLEGKVVGVMNVGYRLPHMFEEDESRMLGALASAAALAVNNASLHERIARLAVTDELTGLPNRRRFLEVVRLEVQRARRYSRPLTLLMVDLDRLKQINDQNGHAAGDVMLRGVADGLRSSMRQTDVPARLGGDEFAVLLPETGRDDALPIAERIRVNVEKFRAVVEGAEISSTVSIGLVSRNAGELTDLPSLIRLADDALYRAKAEGRNAITIAEG